MNLKRTVQWVAAVAFVVLSFSTAWLLSLDTPVQKNWTYSAFGLVLLSAVIASTYAVRRYQRLDELSQRIHLVALAVAFVSSLTLVAAWALAQLGGFLSDFVFLRRLMAPGAGATVSYYLLALMIGLYLIGWLVGRSRYR